MRLNMVKSKKKIGVNNIYNLITRKTRLFGLIFFFFKLKVEFDFFRSFSFSAKFFHNIVYIFFSIRNQRSQGKKTAPIY